MIQTIVISLFATYQLSSAVSSRLLLQQQSSLATLHPEEIPSELLLLPFLPRIPPPPGYELGAFGQVCPETPLTQCNATSNWVSDIDGTLMCDKPAECCKCHSIQCGYGLHKCEYALFGTQAAYGVDEIAIDGSRNGSVIHCNGLRSCQMTTIYATNVISMICSGNRACQYSHIIITDPVEHFTLECSGLASCDGLKVEINFSGPQPGSECKHVTDPTYEKKVFEIAGIECDAGEACNLAEITINNEMGCDTVSVEQIECNKRHACDNTVFNLIGDAEIKTCLCGSTCDTAIGLDTCHRAV